MSEKHLVRGILAGVAGGLVASWVMNEFLAGPGKRLTDRYETSQEIERTKWATEHETDSTMKVADTVANIATGGRHLTWEEQQKGGPVVHYAFGGLVGGLYGGLAEYSKGARSGFGTTFGTALFTAADVVAVPALNLSQPVNEQPAPATGTHYMAHLIYGATTELVRRIVRAVL